MNPPLSNTDNGHIIGGAAHKATDAAIGKLLLDAGKLKPHDMERVLKLQHDQDLRFGEAAIKLGLVTEADIQHALSFQFEYPYLSNGHQGISPELVTATVDSVPVLRGSYGIANEKYALKVAALTPPKRYEKALAALQAAEGADDARRR